MGLNAMILVFWMLSFKPTFSCSSFTFIKRLYSSSSFSAIRVVSSAYLRLLIFLPAILIPTCASHSPTFLMMYSIYMLSKQGDNIQSWHTPFPIWNQSVVPCPVLTVASWSAYKFLRRQVRWSGLPISWRIFHSLLWIIRPFRYELNQTPYDYTVEVTNRFKELNLINRMPEELWTKVCDIVQQTVIKTIPKKKMQKGKMVVWGGLTNSVKRREVKGKGEEERYTHLNA